METWLWSIWVVHQNMNFSMFIVFGQVYIILLSQNDDVQKKLKFGKEFPMRFLHRAGPRDQNSSFCYFSINRIADFQFFWQCRARFWLLVPGTSPELHLPNRRFPSPKGFVALIFSRYHYFSASAFLCWYPLSTPKVPHFVSVNVITAALRFADEALSVCCRGLSSFVDEQHSVHLRLREQERGAILGLQYFVARLGQPVRTPQPPDSC